MAIEKIEILGAVLELPSKQYCQFSLFNVKIYLMGLIGTADSSKTAPMKFDFFQLPWVPIIHLSLFPLSIECPNLLDITNFS